MPSSWLEEEDEDREDQTEGDSSNDAKPQANQTPASDTQPSQPEQPEPRYAGPYEPHAQPSYPDEPEVTSSEYPDDINRPTLDVTPHDRSQNYSPTLPDSSPVVDGTNQQTRESDIDSLFEDSDSEGEYEPSMQHNQSQDQDQTPVPEGRQGPGRIPGLGAYLEDPVRHEGPSAIGSAPQRQEHEMSGGRQTPQNAGGEPGRETLKATRTRIEAELLEDEEDGREPTPFDYSEQLHEYRTARDYQRSQAHHEDEEEPPSQGEQDSPPVQTYSDNAPYVDFTKDKDANLHGFSQVLREQRLREERQRNQESQEDQRPAAPPSPPARSQRPFSGGILGEGGFLDSFLKGDGQSSDKDQEDPKPPEKANPAPPAQLNDLSQTPTRPARNGVFDFTKSSDEYTGGNKNDAGPGKADKQQKNRSFRATVSDEVDEEETQEGTRNAFREPQFKPWSSFQTQTPFQNQSQEQKKTESQNQNRWGAYSNTGAASSGSQSQSQSQNGWGAYSNTGSASFDGQSHPLSPDTEDPELDEPDEPYPIPPEPRPPLRYPYPWTHEFEDNPDWNPRDRRWRETERLRVHTELQLERELREQGEDVGDRAERQYEAWWKIEDAWQEEDAERWRNRTPSPPREKKPPLRYPYPWTAIVEAPGYDPNGPGRVCGEEYHRLEAEAQARKEEKEWDEAQAREAAAAAAQSEANPETQKNEINPGHDCHCGGNASKCGCHPDFCECDGCDHTEQAAQLRAEAQRKWGSAAESERENIDDDPNDWDGDDRTSCGCDGGQQRCSCLPGLCNCKACIEHHRPTWVDGEFRGCRCNIEGGRCQCQPDECACVHCDEHSPKENQRCTCRHGNVCQCPLGRCRCPKPSSAPEPRHTTTYQRDLTDQPSPCRCREGGTCYCAQGMCNCRKVPSAPEPRYMPSQRPWDEHICYCRSGGVCHCEPGWCKCPKPQSEPESGTVPQACACREGGTCHCAAGKCSCRRAQSDPEPGTLRRAEPLAAFHRTPSSFTSRQDSRPLHLKLAALVENPAHTSTTPLSSPPLMSGGLGVNEPTMSSQMAAPPLSRQASVGRNRPDTPRPPPDSTPSTPYAADVLQDYVRQSVKPEYALPHGYSRQQSIEPELTPSRRNEDDEDVRQSVEPEYPPPNWARESTPAYEDRSFTPSPFSRHDDLEMRDASDATIIAELEREVSVPPSDLDDRRSMSPQRPVPPPIPDSDSPIKQPKRGDRRKLGVQGAKVDKRSTTGGKAKSRNTTRKPTASVGKLVDKAKKDKKAAAESAQSAGAGGEPDSEQTPSTPAPQAASSGSGKVAAAVQKIEQQVKQREEDNKDAKQKDGTPVRRSTRANKGMRTSLG